jgi:hypothetical protein
MRLKRNSPREASATPEDIIKTMTANFRLGSWMRKVQDIMRIATGVNACGNMEMLDRKKGAGGGRAGETTCLEHLDVGYAEIEIRSIAEDETCAKEKADGENRPNKHVLREMDILCAVEEASCPL